MDATRSKHLRKGPTAFFVLRSRLEKNLPQQTTRVWRQVPGTVTRPIKEEGPSQP
jgi:hypothetical protein